ncbi:MAG: dihydroorotate dehydrogenase electron transfer subunit [Candidatus Nanopelagicaceae bacterium]
MSNRRLGVYHQIVIELGDLVRHIKPGNFIAISVGGDTSRMILRRAFAISRVNDRGTIELIVSPMGSGSKWLCSQNEGNSLDVVVPLGTAFGIPTEPVSALLVGGGYGSAPLFGLADVLKEHGHRVIMALGASSAAKIYAPIEGRRSASLLKIYTEDGSAGETGRVTDNLAQLINEYDIRAMYSCGPMAMLQALSEIAKEADIAHQCAVEESMACGVGICMTCVIPVQASSGEIKNLRSCIDGPVLDGESVQWHLVGQQL